MKSPRSAIITASITLMVCVVSYAFYARASNLEAPSCESKVKEANELLSTVDGELASYRELKKAQLTWAVKHDAQSQALSIISDYRSKVSSTSHDVVRACHVSTGARIYRRLEDAFDRLNVEVALAEIRRDS